ncbi:MAG: helix-turn-helix transcriptional regulator [Gammaproteobacteria bacterium]|nr:helix-turn-helix transcriptional regulator [Gammaproteobacteria bacterium]
MLAAVMLEQVYRALTGPVTGGIRPQHIHALRLQVVLDHIREHLADSLPVEKLAELAALSVAHFRRLFREAMGVPPHLLYPGRATAAGASLLATTGLPIARIAEDCGYSSQSHLSASFRAAHAATPAEFPRAPNRNRSQSR